MLPVRTVRGTGPGRLRGFRCALPFAAKAAAAPLPLRSVGLGTATTAAAAKNGGFVGTSVVLRRDRRSGLQSEEENQWQYRDCPAPVGG
jgi:hypothetical protein